VKGLGATGYGEAMVAKAFGADFHTVETIAHAHAALHEVPMQRLFWTLAART